jgi:ribonuclease P protein component
VLHKIKSKDNFKNPFVAHTHSFTILFEKSPSLIEYDEFRVVVPKKNIKKAVSRNRVKRQLNAMLFDFSKRTILHCKIVLVANNYAYAAQFSELEKDFNYAVKKYKVHNG